MKRSGVMTDKGKSGLSVFLRSFVITAAALSLIAVGYFAVELLLG